jgi:predicted secreted protein
MAMLPEDELVIALPENRTTGWRWMDQAALEARVRRVQRPAPPRFGDQVASPGRGEREATLAEGPPDLAITFGVGIAAGMRVVSDSYSPGWADVDTRDARIYRLSLRSQHSGRAELLEVELENELTQSVPGVGATGRRWLSVQAVDEGAWRCLLYYASAYDASAPPAMTFSVDTVVVPEPAVVHRRRLVDMDLANPTANL